VAGESFTYLVVEGIHDAQFLLKLLEFGGFRHQIKEPDVDAFWKPLIPPYTRTQDDLHARVPTPFFASHDNASVCLQYAEGDTKIINTVEVALLQLDKKARRPSSIGIFLDADAESPALKRYTTFALKFAAKFRDLNIAMPELPGQVRKLGALKAGAFVLPDNTAPGALEDILLDCASIEYPEITSAANAYVERIEGANLEDRELKDLTKASVRAKVVVSTIASVLKPGKAIQVSVKGNRWLSSRTVAQPKIAAIQTFLATLMQQDEVLR
jgi:hypothetical protein